jgi:ssRNA-specific RNase YbeY (16S rRNA maturation enzyme)
MSFKHEYGTIHRNTFSQIIVDAFGAVRERQNNGIVLIFDEEKIKELKRMYDQQDKAKDRYAAPDTYVEPHKNEYNNTLEDKIEGSVSSEGYRVCGFIIE